MENYQYITLILTSSISIGFGWFLHSFIVGGWTNKELFTVINWILSLEDSDFLRGKRLKTIMNFFHKDQTLLTKIDKINFPDERLGQLDNENPLPRFPK
jgi:hypothetical protein